MQRTTSLLGLVLLIGCAAPTKTVPPSVPPTVQTGAAAQTDFDRALASLVAHDKAHDWNETSCREVARRFESIGSPPALFDAALAYQRCGLVGDGIRTLERAVIEGKFQDAPALVALAKLQMVRDGATPDAKLNVQRALAIDDNSMPAYDQLAQWYLKAKRLDLAALVCAQAMKKNKEYVPIMVTAGLVEHEAGRINTALTTFGQARKLDPMLFDAQMNYALLNLSIRGFDQAQDGFARAIALRPNDYEAHLGMAIALRGPLTGTEDDLAARIAAVQAELDAAKKIDAKRPDAFFNEAILTQEFRARLRRDDTEATKASLRQAAHSFETFVGMASGNARYDVAVKRARGRIDDIQATLDFL